MTLPLYDSDRTPKEYRPYFNAGLWYDKFCSDWEVTGSGWTLRERKLNWINRLNEKSLGSPELIKEMTERTANLILSLRGEIRCFETKWRFVTGLGREHPVENGLAWHHTLGIPFLPGTSIKGVVRAWAEDWVDEDQEKIGRIFGSSAKTSGKQVGSVLFFDALPMAPVMVESDVMTPHYGPYYQAQGVPEPPGDWYDPTPIPYLTVASEQVFLFGLAPRQGASPEDLEDCSLAAKWLEELLVKTGAGAKTAVGYGRFNRRMDQEKALEQWLGQRGGLRKATHNKTQLAINNPMQPESGIAAEMYRDGYNDNPDRFMLALTTKWLIKLTALETESTERDEIARRLADWYQTHKPDQWRKPNKKNSSKIAIIKKALESSQ